MNSLYHTAITLSTLLSSFLPIIRLFSTKNKQLRALFIKKQSIRILTRMNISFKKTGALALFFCFILGGCAPAQTESILPPYTPSAPQTQPDFSEKEPTQPEQESPTPPSPEHMQPVIDGVWTCADSDISRIDSTRQLVALTFDDAPTGRLDALLEVFLQFNRTYTDAPASATFFCNGQGLFTRNRASLQTAFVLGMELANHSFSHLDLTECTLSQLRWEIDEVDALLQEIDGKELHLFRAPYGRINEQVQNAVKTPVIDWYIDTQDWASLSADSIVNEVFARLEPGAIVLLHDGYESTVEAVRRLLPALYEQHYQAVSVSQIAKAHGCRLQVGKVYTRARKPL